MRLIPPEYGPKTPSGERIMFEELAAASFDATVFHSLMLAWHREKPSSETDFLLVSTEGFLVVEVKSGGVSRDADGIWWYQGREGRARDTEGPFAQAETACWALRDRLLESVGQSVVNELTFGWSVSFPQCVFDHSSVEWDASLIYDQRNRGAGATARWLKNACAHWRARTGKRPASADAVKQVSNALRPEFHVVPTLRATAEEVDLEVERLTAEQASRLDLIEECDRVLVRGGAGTGKTFLALETLRTHAAQGESVALLVPSPELRSFLERRPGIAGRCFLVGPRPDAVEPVDVLVVDEAQDVLDFEGLETLAQWVKGGLESGRWRIFVDENNQAALLGRFDPDALDWLKSLGATPARLTTNCRNTASVVDHVSMVTGADIGIPTVASGPGVEMQFAADAEVEAKLLAAHLKRLDQAGVEPCDIAIVTPTPEGGCIPMLPAKLQGRLVLLTPAIAADPPADKIILASPRAIKGLEARFVCFVDGAAFDGSDASIAELYVSMTRSRAALWACFRDTDKDAVTAAVNANLRKAAAK
jgi:hypothetical protein